MSNLRKRNVKFAEEEKKSKPSIIKKVQFALGSVIFKRRENSNIVRIEQMSVIPYIIAFVVFLVMSRYLVEYIHHISDDGVIASREDQYTRLFVEVPCSNDYGKQFKQCTPNKCGRVIRDNLFEKDQLEDMKSIAKKGMKYGGGSGGATILDLHSGALSYKDKFANLYKMEKNVFSERDFKIYANVKNRILETIADEFDIKRETLYLTKPTFFSRIDNKPAVAVHDEYWHPHVDRETYGTFYYTALLYLSDYDVDFTGGRFLFTDKYVNKSVEPRFGRLSFFTSGSENQHFVEKVRSGTRYAVTVSFTCDKKHGIADPSSL